jgi:hypothetical protein
MQNDEITDVMLIGSLYSGACTAAETSNWLCLVRKPLSYQLSTPVQESPQKLQLNEENSYRWITESSLGMKRLKLSL